MMTAQVYARAAVLAGQLDGRQQALLKVLCKVAAASLAGRLRQGLTPEDCGEDFLAAASLHALAALESVREEAPVEEIKAGDLTVKTASREAASRRLQQEAEALLRPYLEDSFSFAGV